MKNSNPSNRALQKTRILKIIETPATNYCPGDHVDHDDHDDHLDHGDHMLDHDDHLDHENHRIGKEVVGCTPASWILSEQMCAHCCVDGSE